MAVTLALCAVAFNFRRNRQAFVQQCGTEVQKDRAASDMRTCLCAAENA